MAFAVSVFLPDLCIEIPEPWTFLVPARRYQALQENVHVVFLSRAIVVAGAEERAISLGILIWKDCNVSRAQFTCSYHTSCQPLVSIGKMHKMSSGSLRKYNVPSLVKTGYISFRTTPTRRNKKGPCDLKGMDDEQLYSPPIQRQQGR